MGLGGVICFGAAAAVAPLAGQTTWVSGEAGASEPGIGLELLRPSEVEMQVFRDDMFITTRVRGVAAFLTGRYPLRQVDLVGELPLARGSRTETDESGSRLGESSDVALGNLYLGIERRPRNSGYELSLGLRLGTSSGAYDDAEEGPAAALITGFVVSAGERADAFSPLKASMGLGLRRVIVPSDIVRMRVGAGVTYVFPDLPDVPDDQGSTFDDPFFVLRYIGESAITWNRWRGAVAFHGYFALEEYGIADDDSHALEIWGDYHAGRFRPGLMLRSPLGFEINGSRGGQLVIGAKVDVTL